MIGFIVGVVLTLVILGGLACFAYLIVLGESFKH
jgi:hypothetical protein